MDTARSLASTLTALLRPGTGILAADESGPTIAKRFETIALASTEEHRRAYRQLLLGTPGLGEYVAGVILFEETLGQRDDGGTPLPQLAANQGIVPGVKVDQGKTALALCPGDEITEGLDGLTERLEGFKAQGARFAKWRAVFHIGETLPSTWAVEANAHALARYAAICQSRGVVPIVEPEVLMDGAHDIARCEAVSTEVLLAVFGALQRHHIVLEHMLLKPSMVRPGSEQAQRASPGEIAAATLRVLRRTVPSAVPGIVFLSGGQSSAEATANLDAMNRLGPLPWRLSFSYGRALQDAPLQAWKGQAANIGEAQRALLHRARLNGAASRGSYTPAMEAAAAA